MDTPGHEAFSAIRARGAKVADIAVLVVAADESVKPQTKEAIRAIKEEDVPFIVAINKIDKENSNPQKVRQDLATEDVIVEDWGGKVPIVEISAKDGRNIPELLEMILLVAELEELKEDLSSPAEGVIIESNLDKQRGYVATALTQKGILKLGDWIVAGAVIGKVKSMEDFKGEPLFQAIPSQPVLIVGWPFAPEIGITFVVTESKEEALKKQEEESINPQPLFSFFKSSAKTAPESGKKILNLIFKTDVLSSLEAIETALQAIKSEDVGYRVLGYDIGNISEADLKTAMGTKATVVGFRVEIDGGARKLAEREGIKVTNFNIIYDLIEFVRQEMTNLLEPVINKVQLGKLRVLALFKKEGKSQVIGGKVTVGKVTRGAMIDRNGIKIGRLLQLQKNKEDVTEVAEGNECGMKIELADISKDIKESDTLEIYEEEKIKRSL